MSTEQILRQFDVFTSAPTCTAIEKAYYADVHPVNAIDSRSPITFDIKGSEEDYCDLSRAHLYLKVKVVQGATGVNLPERVGVRPAAADDEGDPGERPDIAPETNFMSTIFSNVVLTIGGKTVYNAHHMYGYQSLLELLLFSHEREQQNILVCGGYREDQDPGGMGTDFFRNGRDNCRQSREMEFIGQLNVDLFKQNKFLLPGVDMKLTLEIANNTFCLRVGANAVALNPTIAIQECILYVRKVKAAPTIFNSHVKGLQGHSAVYPIDRMNLSTFNINRGLTSHHESNFIKGVIPKMLVVCLVRHDAFNGSFEHSPYNFEHFDLNYLSLTKDGEPYPAQPFQPNFAAGRFVREYYYMQMAVNSQRIQLDLPPLNVIEPHDFVQGYALFAFNMQEDTDCVVRKTGNLRLDFRFANPLPHPITVITYAVYKNRVEIDMQKEVEMDYTA